MHINLTEGERQFIEIMREQEPADNLTVTIEFMDGAWEVSMSAVGSEGRQRTVRGNGRTFSEAWERADPTWA